MKSAKQKTWFLLCARSLRRRTLPLRLQRVSLGAALAAKPRALFRVIAFVLLAPTLLSGQFFIFPEEARAEELKSETNLEENSPKESGDNPASITERNPFWRDASISGALYYFQRYRDRYDVNKERYLVNLSHATSQISAEFTSGYLGGVIGLDVGAFGAVDLYNHGAPDHEMNFFPWRDPWHPDWGATHVDNGASLYKANLKFKAGPLWGRLGYFQPTGPSVMGVNWSFLPGTYQGAEMGADIGKLTVAGTWANEYKAPWFKDTYHFLKNDGASDVAWMWSLGARYNFEKFSLEAAYGESQGYLTNAHIKLRYNTSWDNDKQSLYLTAQTYFMGDSASSGPNDNFDGLALHEYLAAHYNYEAWRFRLEFLYTRAPANNENNVGYFAYRLVSRYGGANGAYEPWWDNRSDWNHDNEKAVFGGISRDLSDIIAPGWDIGAGYAMGWDGEAYGVSTHLKEQAFNTDLSYTFQKGWLQGSTIKLHYTWYDNMTDFPSWDPFQNAFQDEHDIKFSIVIPFGVAFADEK